MDFECSLVYFLSLKNWFYVYKLKYSFVNIIWHKHKHWTFLLSPSLVPAASWCGIAAVQFTQITWLFFFHLFHWRQALSLTLQLVSLCIARHDLRLKSLGCRVNTHLNTLDQWTDNTFVFIEVLTLADCQLMKCIWLAISGWYVCSYCLRK